MHKDYDIVVIGGGPAGAVAARDAARAGARVALVDGSHPREKACGGGVTGRALKVAGTFAANVPGTFVRAAVFEADGRSARVPIDGNEALRVVSRTEFDAALLADAIGAGAAHLPTRALRAGRDGGSWTVTTADDRVLRAPWIVGADGPCGITRKRLFRPFERSQLSIAAGSFVDDARSDEVTIAFLDEPSGYFWSFPRPGHIAAGACAQATDCAPSALHAVTDRWLDRYPPAAGRKRRRYAWPIPSLSARDLESERLAGDGWMLAGDAAGLVDPITREGIYFALRSGQLAARALATRDSPRTYSEMVRDELHAELRRAAELKRAFFRPRFTRLLIDALDESASIRRVMIDLIAGTQSYEGLKRRLIGTFELRLMLKLVTGNW